MGAMKMKTLLYGHGGGRNGVPELALRWGAALFGPRGTPVHSLKEIIDFNEKNAAKEMPYFGQDTMIKAQAKGPLTSPAYLKALKKNHELTRRLGIDAVVAKYKLDALVAYRKNREFRIQQEHLLESAQDAARLSQVRFKAGTTDYLEVLTNETNSFSAELGLAQAQGNELIALVQLYEALGGGWQ